MSKDNIFTGVVLVLIGVAIAVVAVILIQIHSPAPQIKLCNDGWTRQEIDGKIVETYLPAEDTCKKGE